MKKYLLAIFVLATFLSKAQCAFTSSVTNPGCGGTCNGSVSFYLTGSCTAFPYSISITNGGGCPITSSVVMTSSVATINGLCACGSPFSAILFDNVANFVGLTSFFVTGPPTMSLVTATSTLASCGACCDGSVSTISFGGTPPYTYTWTPAGPATGTLTNACPGSYTLCAKDAGGCVVCKTYSVGFATGIYELQTAPVKLIYGEDKITFENTTSINYVTVYDLSGRLIFKSERNEQNSYSLNKQNFNKGVYLVYLEGERILSRQKIVID